MSIYDAESQNTVRSTRQYTDLDLFFGRRPSDSDVRKVTDIQAVKRSIRNLVQLNTYEKPFRPEISGGVRELLFEPMSPIASVVIARKIEDVIKNFEPRVRLVQVNVHPFIDRNGYRASISFYVINHPEPVTVETMLERLR